MQDRSDLESEIIAACRVLTNFKMVEGFGHVSARLPGSENILITPRKALALVSRVDLVELDPAGQQVAGQGRPPLEVPMHLAVYRRRPQVAALCRAHPRAVASFAASCEPIQTAHGFGANLGPLVPVFTQPFLIADAELAEGLADALGDCEAVILQANGMLATGESVPDACVKAIFLEEMAEIQLAARAAGLTPKAFSPETAARRRGMDQPHEPVRAWEFYLAIAGQTKGE
jgi:ribulose-5-phosphate 4-epimerase/fuculose-1-phosphate aldolase